MALYKICDLVIMIKSHFEYITQICKDYEINDNCEPDIILEATSEDIEKERLKNPNVGNSFLESICIFKKLCMEMLNYNGFVFYSSVVAVDDEGFVFTAPKGEGKTSQAILWKQHFKEKATIVNGDSPVIRMIDGNFFAYGTPWCGKENYNANMKVQVKSVCFLEKSQVNRISEMSGVNILYRLFSQVMYPITKENYDKFFYIIDKFIKKTPVYVLRCNLTEQAVTLAYTQMHNRVTYK